MKMFFELELGKNKGFSTAKESECGSSFCSFCWAQGKRGGWERAKKIECFW